MVQIKISRSEYVLRIEPREELFNALLNFARKEKINSAFFYGFGATNKCTFGRYDEKTIVYYREDLIEHYPENLLKLLKTLKP